MAMADSVMDYYRDEINKRKNEQRVFREEANDLFGFNGSLIPLDKYEDLFQKYVLEKGRGNNIIEAFDAWMLERLPNQIKNKVKENPENDTIIFFDNVRIYRPYMVGIAKGELPEGLPPSDGIVPMYPRDAMIRKDTYAAEIHVDIFSKKKNSDETFATRLVSAGVVIGKVPIMKGSYYCWLRGMSDEEKIAAGECFNDPLGYFIVGGMEKVIVAEEKQNAGQMLISKANSKKTHTSIRMTSLLLQNSIVISLEINPKKDDVIEVLFHKNIQIPALLLSLLIHFLQDDELIEEAKSGEEHMRKLCENLLQKVIVPEILDFVAVEERNLVEPRLLSTITKTLDLIETAAGFLGTKKDFNPLEVLTYHLEESRRKDLKKTNNFYRSIRDEIKVNVFPSREDDTSPDRDSNDFSVRRTMLGKMISVYIRHLAGFRPEDDRDSYFSKRIDSAARTMEIQFNTIFRKIVSDLKLNSAANDFTNAFDQRLRSGVPNDGKRETIAEPIQRETPAAVYSQLQRVTSKAENNAGESVRVIHPTQYGFICTGETPDGENCGVLKNLTSVCWLSISRRDDEIYDLFKEFLRPIKETDDHLPLMLNGNICGWVDQNEYQTLRKKIKMDLRTFDVVVALNTMDNHIDVFSSGSIPTRPLLIVNPATKRLFFDDIDKESLRNLTIDQLIEEGILEFVSPQEIEALYPSSFPLKGEEWETLGQNKVYVKIAEYPKDVENLALNHANGENLDEQPYTHSEIVPHAQFGYSASCIPKANLNKGPRITYQCSMFKQALSGYHSVYPHRFDTKAKIHQFPSRAMFETSTYGPIGINAMPTTSTPIIAILAKSMNNEDAIVAKREFLDNNLRYAVYSTHTIPVTDEKITVREENEHDPSLHALYKASDGVPPEMVGFPRIGAKVKQGDAILGKYSYSINSLTGQTEYRKSHAKVGLGGDGFVVAVESIRSKQNNKLVRVKICQQRRQVEGDKVASRYSQKGTFGQILPERELPRIIGGVNNGVVPDLFFNPHSIPSRLTQGKILEILSSKAALFTGERVNSSPFGEYENDDYMEKYEEILVKNGMEKSGLEKMIHPDGTPMEAHIFVGACAYQLLKHHVADKAQFRDTGRYEPKTHQPVGGRTNRGGLRIGEMERDALISHGTSYVVQDRLMGSSDLYRVVVCKRCGNIAKSNFTPQETTCGYCPDSKEFGAVNIPYISHLIIRVLNGAGVHIHYKV